MSKSRAYVGTVFADHEEDPLPLLPVESWPPFVTFVRYQRELCPVSNREHFQIYIELNSPQRLTRLRDECEGLSNSWLQPRKGSQRQAMAYCSKEDTRIEGPWDYGEKHNQGERADLEAVKIDLDKGHSMKRIAEDHFPAFTRYHNSFRQYKRLQAVKRDWAMEIYIVIGPSGTGKTRWARETFPDAYWKPHGKWWDNYDGQDTVIIDEMYGNRFSFTELLNLMDRYPHSIEIKGGSVEFTSHTLVLTSNQHPEDWYDPQRTHQHMRWEDNPLKRRIDEFATVIYMGNLIRQPVLNIVGPAIDGQPRLGGI